MKAIVRTTIIRPALFAKKRSLTMTERSAEHAMKLKQKQLYEKRRLEYLLENKLGEIEAYKEEIRGLREINSLCAAFILYFLRRESRDVDGVMTAQIAKDEISEIIGKYGVGCVSEGNCYKVTLEEKENEKA